MWIPLVVYVVATGAAAIGIIEVDSVRNFIQEVDVKVGANTRFMKKLYIEADILRQSEPDSDIKKILSDIADEIRYSDPVSNSSLQIAENELYEVFLNVKNVVKERNIGELQSAYVQFHEKLITRNNLCKLKEN